VTESHKGLRNMMEHCLPVKTDKEIGTSFPLHAGQASVIPLQCCRNVTLHVIPFCPLAFFIALLERFTIWVRRVVAKPGRSHNHKTKTDCRLEFPTT
jgi:hypothetical protein